MARQALGKGLSGLIPTHLQNLEAGSGSVNEIPIAQIRPNRFQPRTVFSSHELKELADSIAAQGVLQPILVRRDGNGFELISGERRFRAVQSLGHRHIPAVIKDGVSDEEMAEWALIENVQRADLNPMEEARAYKRLMDEFKLSQEEVAKKVGKDRATIANVVRLLKLPTEIQNLVQNGKLSMGHARALLAVESAEKQKALGNRAVHEGWSVRQVEQACSSGGGNGKSKPKGHSNGKKDVHLTHMEEQFCRALATKVKIQAGKRGGVINVEYYSNEDLERILEVIKDK